MHLSIQLIYLVWTLKIFGTPCITVDEIPDNTYSQIYVQKISIFKVNLVEKLHFGAFKAPSKPLQHPPAPSTLSIKQFRGIYVWLLALAFALDASPALMK